MYYTLKYQHDVSLTLPSTLLIMGREAGRYLGRCAEQKILELYVIRFLVWLDG